MILKSFHRFKFNRFLHNELFFHKQVVKHCNSRLFATLLPNKSNDESHKNLENIYDIVIVGGGIAGNALACALANSEITKSQRVALIEFSDVSYLKEWKPSPNEFSNRVSALTPQSIEFFKDIGVWKNLVLERVKPFNDIQVWDGITDARLNFNCKDNNTFRTNLENIGWIVENHNIQQAILTQLLQCKDFNFHFFENTKVEGIFLDDSSAYNAPSVNGQFDLSDWPNIKLSDGNFLKTRLLVGADGFNSVVRSFINIESIGWDYDAHAVVATLLVDRLVENVTAWQRFLPTGPIAMLPMQDGFASMVWSTTPALASKIRTLPKNDFINLVNAAFRLRVADLEYFFSQFGNDNFDIGFEFDWRNNVEAKKTSLPPLVLNVQEKSRAGFPLRMRNAESYVDERVVLVGDAAHTIHPLAGQGLNQGLADVQCLAKVIEYGITTGQDLGNLQLLRNYSSERYLSNILMLGAVDKLHKLFGTKITPLVCIRSLGLEMINRIGPLKSEIMKYAMGI